MMYVFVENIVQITSWCPAGFTLTDDVKDIIDDIKSDSVRGAYVLRVESASGLKGALENGEALEHLGLDDRDQEAIETLHATLVGYVREESFE